MHHYLDTGSCFKKCLWWLCLTILSQAVWAASHHPQDFLASIRGTHDEAKQIVHHFCANCHAEKPLIPLGAPKMGVQADWSLRKQQGMHVLYQHTNEGLGLMPARGGCFECSDQQLKLAIEYLIEGENH